MSNFSGTPASRGWRRPSTSRDPYSTPTNPPRTSFQGSYPSSFRPSSSGDYSGLPSRTLPSSASVGSGLSLSPASIHSNGSNGVYSDNKAESRGLKVSDYASLNNSKTKQHTDELKNLLKDSEELARSSTARTGSLSTGSLFGHKRTDSGHSPVSLSEGQQSSGEINIDTELDIGSGHPRGLTSPLVTSPLGSDVTEDRVQGLNSPGMVSTMSGSPYTLSNSSPLNNLSNFSKDRAFSTSNVEKKSSSSVKKSSTSMCSSSSSMGMGPNVTSTEHSEHTASAETFQSVRSADGDVREEKSSALQHSTKSVHEQDGVVATQESGLKHKSNLKRENGGISSSSDTAVMNTNKVKVGGVEASNSTAAVASSRSSVDSTGKLSSESSSSTSNNKKMSITDEDGGTRIWELTKTKNYQKEIRKKMNEDELNRYLDSYDDLAKIGFNEMTHNDVENMMVKYAGVLSNTMDHIMSESNEDSLSQWITKVNNLIGAAVKNPRFGQDIGDMLCGMMSSNGGLDLVMKNLNAKHSGLQLNSAKLLQNVLMTENKNYVVENGLDKAIAITKNYTKSNKDIKKNLDQCRVATGILENLFDHSEETCGRVIEMGGLSTVVEECKSTDPETLRHCASALANAAIYGGSESQEEMIKNNVPKWLFPLLVNNDDTIRYYACLAIAVLCANKEIEAEIQKTDSFKQVLPILAQMNPAEFSSVGKSKAWLLRLLPVLNSEREESKNLAAFHFAMEADQKVKEGKGCVFEEIGAIEALKRVASSPYGIASKYAVQALRSLGEDIPYKLSQQVPTWSCEDVKEWVKQIGFANFSDAFVESRVDGDLLLQLTEEMLKEDIHMRNGILRRRFLRELTNLLKRTDYASVDNTGLNEFLQTLGLEYSVYTYVMLNSGVDKETLLNPINPFLTDEQLLLDCGIGNKIHRIKILQGIKMSRGELSVSDENLEKNIDIFISYRRANGAQLASLLKVHLELQKLSVFLDVSGLEAGKFDASLLQHIQQSRNFLLVCTPGAFERCRGDEEMKDWIHKEVACALDSGCNIIPVIDSSFTMPEPDELPATMRNITKYNGVRWIHEYQEACIEKIVRFISGDERREGSLYSFGRQNTYGRTISQDSTANSIRSESDNILNNIHNNINNNSQ